MIQPRTSRRQLYRRDRNPLLVAAAHGFGNVNLEEIDFETEVVFWLS